jgi:hypothetical protein
VAITIDPATGGHANPLTFTLAVDPADTPVELAATRVTKALSNGLISVTVLESLQRILGNGETVTLSTDGMWELVFRAPGAVDDMRRTYWVGVEPIEATIVTDNATPFQGSLTVVATTSNPRASLYHSLGGDLWNEGANVSITDDAVVAFVAIDPSGTASEVVSRSFKKRVAWEVQATANVNEHFIAGRIGVNEFLTYLGQFGLAPFTLYLVDGDWVLDPRQPVPSRVAPRPAASHESGTFSEPLTVTLSARDEVDPNPRIYYTTDGSDPTPDSPFFAGSGQLRLAGSGTKTVKYFAQNTLGNVSDVETKTYEMDAGDVGPVIGIRDGDPPPGRYRAGVAVTLEAVDDRDGHVTVFYTQDGSIPDEHSPSFQDRKRFELSDAGNHVITCYARTSDGNETYETFYYSIGP